MDAGRRRSMRQDRRQGRKSQDGGSLSRQFAIRMDVLGHGLAGRTMAHIVDGVCVSLKNMPWAEFPHDKILPVLSPTPLFESAAT